MDNKESQKIISELCFCVIDLETTGGNHSKDKIIEIGMVKIENIEVTESKSFLINPETIIPDFIQKLTGISQKDVKSAPIIDDVIEQIIEFIGDDIIVAHNTSFDVPFLNGVLKKLKRPELENNVICTNVMTKHLLPEILNSNLNYMSRLFKIDHNNAHRASDDALATAKLLIIYLNIFISKGLKKVNQLYYPRNKFELDRIHFSKKTPEKEISETLKSLNSSVVITVKGDRGLILATIPLEDPGDEFEFALGILSKLDWNIVTLRLINPMLEGLFQFNNHYMKYPEDVRNEIREYLENKYKSNKQTTSLDRLDFILAHHLIEDQVIAYSFLNLNTNLRAIFKIPAQKKKIYQFLLNQINKFEGHQKGKRKHLIHQDLTGLIESFLTLEKEKENQTYLYIDRKDIKKDKENSIKIIEGFVGKYNNRSKFPTTHL
jgi:DNA polymerase-3 subunit alpha (Gram-positive type)